MKSAHRHSGIWPNQSHAWRTGCCYFERLARGPVADCQARASPTDAPTAQRLPPRNRKFDRRGAFSIVERSPTSVVLAPTACCLGSCKWPVLASYYPAGPTQEVATRVGFTDAANTRAAHQASSPAIDLLFLLSRTELNQSPPKFLLEIICPSLPLAGCVHSCTGADTTLGHICDSAANPPTWTASKGIAGFI